jgi:hypothetical protein
MKIAENKKKRYGTEEEKVVLIIFQHVLLIFQAYRKIKKVESFFVAII